MEGVNHFAPAPNPIPYLCYSDAVFANLSIE